jgi:hypothetical protein
MLFPRSGEAMTMWWIKLTIFCFICDFIPLESIQSTLSLLHLFSFRCSIPEGMEDLSEKAMLLWAVSMHKVLKGVCATSGACVFTLYYTFTFIYNAHNTPRLAEQIYISKNLGDIMPYSLYIIRDHVAHFVLTCLIIMSWYKYVTFAAGIIAFLFHRTWSIINSNFSTIYLDGTDVYKVKKTPHWAWQVVYVLEMTVLIVSTSLSIYLQ